jgi:hypothetical protein
MKPIYGCGGQCSFIHHLAEAGRNLSELVPECQKALVGRMD